MRSARALLLVAALALCIPALPGRADGLEGRFEVRSADLELKDGVYHLNARIELPISDAVRRGLAEGVPLTLEVDLDVERVRQLLPNSRVAELTQRYHLQYNAVSGHYVLRNDNSGQQESIGTVDAALESLAGDQKPARCSTNRCCRTIGATRRACAPRSTTARCPSRSGCVMFWVNEWHRESDWYTWTLQP